MSSPGDALDPAMACSGMLPEQRPDPTTHPRPSGRGLNFAAIDVETANSFRGSICSFGITIVQGGRITEEHTWLTKPPDALSWFDGFNVALHGITPEMVTDAPHYRDSLDHALTLVGDLPVLAHNAAFDVGAIRQSCDFEDLYWPRFDYGCSLVMARRALNLISYRLPLVADECGVDLRGHHDAGADASACAQIVLELARRQQVTTLDGLLDSLGVLWGHLDMDSWRGCHSSWRPGQHGLVTPDVDEDADPTHPLYGQVVVFTGALSIRRQDAWDMVARHGATPEHGVTKRTTLLVIGDGFTGNDPGEFFTGKAVKAAKLRDKGQIVEVLTELDLVDLLDSTVHGRRGRATHPERGLPPLQRAWLAHQAAATSA